MTTKTPGVDYNELDSNPNYAGSGCKPTIFIGKSTSTNTKAPTKILTFEEYEDAEKSVANGGIGPEPSDLSTNPLLKRVKEYFEETKEVNDGDVGCDYIYVIDLGSEPTTADWSTAVETAAIKDEIQLMGFVGVSDISVMEAVNTILKDESVSGKLKIAFFTEDGASDADLIKLTDSTQTSSIQHVRIYITVPENFGKIIGRVAVTSYLEEVGYRPFRSVLVGESAQRSKTEETALLNAGIMFIRDETVDGVKYPRICLGTSTAFAAASEKTRPNDSLLQAKTIVDNLARRVYNKLSLQVKRNETETNLKYTKTDVDTIIDDEITNKSIKSANITIAESNSNPYDLEVKGRAMPVNSTHNINFSLYVEAPDSQAVEK